MVLGTGNTMEQQESVLTAFQLNLILNLIEFN